MSSPTAPKKKKKYLSNTNELLIIERSQQNKLSIAVRHSTKPSLFGSRAYHPISEAADLQMEVENLNITIIGTCQQGRTNEIAFISIIHRRGNSL
jgi:hypothetical protein